MSAATAITFMRAAPTYWGSVYPRVRGEIECQRKRAAAIPDPELRRIALGVLRTKRANIDGAAAFAAFVPRVHRAAVIRAQVAFQSLYDYLDTLTEQPHDDPVANSRSLHRALVAALDPHVQSRDYCSAQTIGDDGGYLQSTVERCQTALSALPGYAAVRPSAARLGAHIVEYQSLNLPWIPSPPLAGCRGMGNGAQVPSLPLAGCRGMGNEAEAPSPPLSGWRGRGNGGAQDPHEMLERWAAERTPPESGLAWWETAASAGSSLGLFALIAMAAQPRPSAAEALAVENVYFPWVGALHSLLDSLIDLPEDRASGQPALIEHYGSAGEAAAGLRRLARESRRQVAALPHSDQHTLMLASMAAIYLAEPRVGDPHVRAARRAVLGVFGAPSTATMAVMHMRRLALSAHSHA
jgi:tetraprenyl-beta-curcumene synthase